jgi:hypothetical protein
MTYDSSEDTRKHINRVRYFLLLVRDNLLARDCYHDRTKLEDPEKAAFDEYTPMLSELEYGSEEYRACLRQMKPALQHHYENNSHHPEHYENGINGMSLLDLIEMLCDWRAASERTKQRMDGDEYLKKSFADSLEYNKERFKMDDQLYGIIVNTARELGFIE